MTQTQYHLLAPIPVTGTLIVGEHPNMQEEDEWWVCSKRGVGYRTTYLIGPFPDRPSAVAAREWAYAVRSAHAALTR